MRKYFTYLLKKNILPLICLSLFCLIVYVVPILLDNYSIWNDSYDAFFAERGIYYTISIYDRNITVALGILSVFVPIFIFSYKMNHRSIDMHYSLPITKTKILASNYFVGLILMYGAYTIAYIIGFIAIVTKVERLHLIYYLWLYLASIIPAFIFYSIIAFIYTRANTITDGLISVIGTLFSFSILVAAISEISSLFPNSFELDWTYFLPFASLAHVAENIGGGIFKGEITGVYGWFKYPKGSNNYNNDMQRMVADIIWALLGIMTTIGLFVNETKSKAERCEQVSESIFCYKTQIPFYTSLLIVLSLGNLGINSAFIIAIIFAAFVMMIIYRRTIKIGWKNAIVLGVSIFVGLLVYYFPLVISNIVNPQQSFFLILR